MKFLPASGMHLYKIRVRRDDGTEMIYSSTDIMGIKNRLISDSATAREQNDFCARKNNAGEWEVHNIRNLADPPVIEYEDKPALHFDLTPADEASIKNIKYSYPSQPIIDDFLDITEASFPLGTGRRSIVYAIDVPDTIMHGGSTDIPHYHVIAMIDHDQAGNIISGSFVDKEWINEKTTNPQGHTFTIDVSLKTKLGIGSLPSVHPVSSYSPSGGSSSSGSNLGTTELVLAGILAATALGTGIGGWRNRVNKEKTDSPHTALKVASVSLGALAAGLVVHALLGKGRSK